MECITDFRKNGGNLLAGRGFLKGMPDKPFELPSREERKENSLNFAILACFAVNFMRSPSFLSSPPVFIYVYLWL
ncbi:MAG: hypothetical protein Kow0070_31380 [Anaerolineales bacterium]